MECIEFGRIPPEIMKILSKISEIHQKLQKPYPFSSGGLEDAHSPFSNGRIRKWAPSIFECPTEDRGSKVEDEGSRIEGWGHEDRESGSEDRESRVENGGSRIEDRGSRIDDRGSRIEDRGIED